MKKPLTKRFELPSNAGVRIVCGSTSKKQTGQTKSHKRRTLQVRPRKYISAFFVGMGSLLDMRPLNEEVHEICASDSSRDYENLCQDWYFIGAGISKATHQEMK